MKKIILFLIAMVMVSCTATFNEKNEYFEDKYDGFMTDTTYTGDTLYVKYENNTLFLYTDANNCKRYDNIVYNEVKVDNHNKEGLKVVTFTSLYFYDKDTHKVVFGTIQKGDWHTPKPEYMLDKACTIITKDITIEEINEENKKL